MRLPCLGYDETVVVRMHEVVKRVYSFLPFFPTGTSQAELLNLANLAVPMLFVEFPDGKMFSHEFIHAGKIVPGQIVEIAVNAREVT